MWDLSSIHNLFFFILQDYNYHEFFDKGLKYQHLNFNLHHLLEKLFLLHFQVLKLAFQKNFIQVTPYLAINIIYYNLIQEVLFDEMHIYLLLYH